MQFIVKIVDSENSSLKDLTRKQREDIAGNIARSIANEAMNGETGILGDEIDTFTRTVFVGTEDDGDLAYSEVY